MTTFYLIRHGEPTYKPIDERKFMKIVSYPYARALQTFAILSTELGINLEVDINLHE